MDKEEDERRWMSRERSGVEEANWPERIGGKRKGGETRKLRRHVEKREVK